MYNTTGVTMMPTLPNWTIPIFQGLFPRALVRKSSWHGPCCSIAITPWLFVKNSLDTKFATHIVFPRKVSGWAVVALMKTKPFIFIFIFTIPIYVVSFNSIFLKAVLVIDVKHFTSHSIWYGHFGRTDSNSVLVHELLVRWSIVRVLRLIRQWETGPHGIFLGSEHG